MCLYPSRDHSPLSGRNGPCHVWILVYWSKITKQAYIYDTPSRNVNLYGPGALDMKAGESYITFMKYIEV